MYIIQITAQMIIWQVSIVQLEVKSSSKFVGVITVQIYLLAVSAQIYYLASYNGSTGNQVFPANIINETLMYCFQIATQNNYLASF